MLAAEVHDPDKRRGEGAILQMRHAGASRVDVTLAASNGALTLHISDNGCGFDLPVARRRYSYGLLGMSERARLIGGTLQIESAPGAGTTVSIHIPLRTEKST